MDFKDLVRLSELEYEQRKRNKMNKTMEVELYDLRSRIKRLEERAELTDLRRRIEKLERAESFNRPLKMRLGREIGNG